MLCVRVCVYVRACVQTWQDRGFAKDMWLEAVNPQHPAEVCVAQVTQVRGRLLWLRLEGTPVCFCVCARARVYDHRPSSLLFSDRLPCRCCQVAFGMHRRCRVHGCVPSRLV